MSSTATIGLYPAGTAIISAIAVECEQLIVEKDAKGSAGCISSIKTDANVNVCSSTDLAAYRQESLNKYLLGTHESDSTHVLNDMPTVPSVQYNGASSVVMPDSLLHPLIRNTYNCHNGNYIHGAVHQSSPLCYSNVVASRLAAVPLQLSTHSGMGVGSSALAGAGVECIEFDRDGVLFMTGNGKGYIAVYDYDECLYNCQIRYGTATNACAPLHLIMPSLFISNKHRLYTTCRSCDYVQPLVTICTGRRISDLHWNQWDSEEVSVSHQFSADIYVYSLGDVSAGNSSVRDLGYGVTDSSVWQNHSVGSQRQNPKHILSLSKGQRSGGHTCIMTVEIDMSDVLSQHRGSSVESVQRCTIAGSTNGRLRMWRHPGKSNSRGNPLTIYPQWEVYADPLNGSAVNAGRGIGNDSIVYPSVVGVCQFKLSSLSIDNTGENETIVVAMTAAGIISYWNVNKLYAASFSSKSIPTNLQRKTLWEFRYSNTVALPMDTSRCVKDVECCNGHVPTVVGMKTTGLYSKTSVDGDLAELLGAVTLSSGVLLTVDLNRGVVLGSSRHTRELNPTGDQNFVDTDMGDAPIPSSVSTVPKPRVVVNEILGKGIISAPTGPPHDASTITSSAAGTSCSRTSAMLSPFAHEVCRDLCNTEQIVDHCLLSDECSVLYYVDTGCVCCHWGKYDRCNSFDSKQGAY